MRDLASPGSCHRINVLSLSPSHQECPYIKARTIPVYSVLWIAGFTYWFGIFFLSLSSTCDLTWEFKYPWQISPLKKLICEAKKKSQKSVFLSVPSLLVKVLPTVRKILRSSWWRGQGNTRHTALITLYDISHVIKLGLYSNFKLRFNCVWHQRAFQTNKDGINHSYLEPTIGPIPNIYQFRPKVNNFLFLPRVLE